MITKINIKGFKSLKDAEVDFCTNKNVADKNKEVVKKHKLINNNFTYTFNVTGIIGSNATGKSTFLDAIYIYKKIVINEFNALKMRFERFFELEKRPKQFSLEYLINENIVKHEILFDENFQIISEKLFLLQEKNSSDSWKLVFDNKNNHSFLWRIAEISSYEKKEVFNLNSLEIDLINQLFKFIKNIMLFNNNWGVYENDQYLLILKRDLKHIFLNKNLETQKMLNLFKILITSVDPNIIDFEYDQLRNEIIVLVKDNNEIIKVLLDNISEGTKRFIFIMMPIFLYKNQSNFYIIDEIENSFHPKIIDTILRLFYFNENNINHSQLLFTTHNPYIFDNAEIHNSCINVSLYNSNKNFQKLSNFENYNIKRNDKIFSKNYVSEIIDSHPDTNNINEIYDIFSNNNAEINLV